MYDTRYERSVHAIGKTDRQTHTVRYMHDARKRSEMSANMEEET